MQNVELLKWKGNNKPCRVHSSSVTSTPEGQTEVNFSHARSRRTKSSISANNWRLFKLHGVNKLSAIILNEP